MSNKIEILLEEFGLKLANDSKSNLKKKLDARAFHYKSRPVKISRLEASINSDVTYGSGKIRLAVEMNDYWDIVEYGRKAGNVSAAGQVSLQKWAEIRGFSEKVRLTDLQNRLKKQKENKTNRKKKKLKKMPFDKAHKVAAFLVARKLKTKDIEATHFFSEVLKDGRIGELNKKLSELIKQDVVIIMNNGINS